MSDLIEQWKNLQLGPNGYCSYPIGELVAATIEALRPVEDEEVRRMCERLDVRANSEDGYWPPILAKQAADLIERLAREKKHYFDYYNRINGRIEQLQSQLAEAKERGDHFKQQWDAAGDTIELLQKAEERRKWQNAQMLINAAESGSRNYLAEIESLQAQIAEYESEILVNAEYESEYDGRSYTRCAFCSSVLSEDEPHHAACVVTRIRQMGEK